MVWPTMCISKALGRRPADFRGTFPFSGNIGTFILFLFDISTVMIWPSGWDCWKGSRRGSATIETKVRRAKSKKETRLARSQKGKMLMAGGRDRERAAAQVGSLVLRHCLQSTSVPRSTSLIFPCPFARPMFLAPTPVLGTPTNSSLLPPRPPRPAPLHTPASERGAKATSFQRYQIQSQRLCPEIRRTGEAFGQENKGKGEKINK
ncbi:hypothetical protein MAPG_03860 [Magnaporthiopsis poae ATCC 64411]|uniref:Uncharacterized protein n=1 Tax=Magnaporthiopsis poae (strain ATCC 64411 / 73-15) TaxID=644358 RepID=A0A0C4DV59_MAGP6|nr:hypothetical protein MAPG_03860 [Magnaporthiopsis poae ATCC 64411]